MLRQRKTATVLSAIAIGREIGSFLGLLLLALLLLPSSPAAVDASQGAQIAAACASCHEPGGRGRAIPPIAALDEQTIVRLMRGYRASEKPSHVMHAVALSLSDEEITAVARYVSAKGKDGGPP
ncbi:c-type cytochrome [Sinorhizobium fredii]|uniref:c-type cytochrome n=1 Tax=Rhizobium fredii TaxID=380 RepID=UPI0033956FCC